MIGLNPGGGVLPMWWVIHMCRGFDPLFSLWQDRARSFWGIFSHPPTPKRSFGVLKLPILKEFDLLGPKFHFSLDLFGSNFQWPAAHPHQFSDRVPPPPPGVLTPPPKPSYRTTAVNTPQSSRTAPMREIKKLSRIVLLENIEYINISHYKCWKLASVTILPVWHFLWSTPTIPLKHADNGSRSDLIDRSLTEFKVLYKLYFTKV